MWFLQQCISGWHPHGYLFFSAVLRELSEVKGLGKNWTIQDVFWMPAERCHSTGQRCRRGAGLVLQHRLGMQLPFEGAFLLSWRLRLDPLDTTADGVDLRPAICQRGYLCLSSKERTQELLLAPNLSGRCPDCRGGVAPLASLKFTETVLHSLSRSGSSRMWESPVGKSAGTGFASCGEERRPVGLPATGTRCPECWESERRNVYGEGVSAGGHLAQGHLVSMGRECCSFILWSNVTLEFGAAEEQLWRLWRSTRSLQR